jgi:predicted short-subunit dehydrogenase-like oxidoreductase (DUF2520 family)
MKGRKLTFSLIGPGKLGMTIANALIVKGYKAKSIISKTEGTIERAKSLLKAESFSTNIEDLTEIGDLLLISVPDDAIEKVAKEVSRSNSQLKQIVCLHFSGVNSSELLMSLEKKGALTGSLHPLYSFGDRIDSVPSGVLFTYEGTAGAESIAEEIVSSLKGKKINIDFSEKPLYHFASSLAGNMSHTLFFLASDIIENVLGQDPQQYRKEIVIYLKSVLRNIQNQSWKEALTGPVKRGDYKTIEKHMDALDKLERKDLKELYNKLIVLTRNMLNNK